MIGQSGVTPAWTPNDDWALDEARKKLESLTDRKRQASTEVHQRLKEFIDKTCKHHDYSVPDGTLARWVMDNRDTLVEILTQGEFSSLCALRQLARDQREREHNVTKNGYCRSGDNCVCGGDVPTVREGCGEWVARR